MTENTARFFAAAGALAGELLARLKTEDAALHATLAEAMRVGGFFTLSCAFGAAGPIDTRLIFVSPAGERTTLFEVGEFEAPTL
jgi:hypothetical protein